MFEKEISGISIVLGPCPLLLRELDLADFHHLSGAGPVFLSLFFILLLNLLPPFFTAVLLAQNTWSSEAGKAI